MSNYEDQKDLGTQGKEDTARGKLNQVAGKIQRKAGGLFGNRKMQVKGAAREAEGKVQSVGGKVEQKVDHALQPEGKANQYDYQADPNYSENV